MEKINFTAIDFETATRHRFPCQLGLTIVRNGQIVEQKSYLIKPPGNRYDKICIDVHNITPDKTQNAPSFADIWPEVFSLLNHEVIVAHNMNFDFDVLLKATDHYELEPITPMSLMCTMAIFNRRSLKDVAKLLNIHIDNHHDACCDSSVCAKIFIQYLNGARDEVEKYPNHEKESTDTYYKQEGRELSSEVKIQDLSIVKNKDNPFYDKTVVISGVLDSYPIREDLAQLLKTLGAKLRSAISSKTNILIAGSDCGQRKAQEAKIQITKGVNISIINEAELLKLLKSV